ncbi:MAG: hypothetical protein ACRBG0_05030 [Lewinella sp.]|uniref:hypothetical protein n=1 Tax=Lewinella sp. TaxID=2004506 RepID=UPI003D6BD9E1
MTIQQAVTNFKQLIHNAVAQGGSKAKTAAIRSSWPILNIHEAVKHQMISEGINASQIHPALGQRAPELKLAGVLKKKDQDICIVPNMNPTPEIMTDGLLLDQEDPYGYDYTERTISINVRSQISSIQKNFDTLYERTASEAQNLHDRCNRMVLGEVYMIAVPEYDDKEFDNNHCIFKGVRTDMVEKYIKSFHAVNSRDDEDGQLYKYESVCLLIVDFRQDPPKIYHSTQELINDGYLPANTTVSYEGLDWANFSRKLLDAYEERFPNEPENKGGGCAPTLFNFLIL